MPVQRRGELDNSLVRTTSKSQKSRSFLRKLSDGLALERVTGDSDKQRRERRTRDTVRRARQIDGKGRRSSNNKSVEDSACCIYFSE
jgi:hypothetical protein